MMSLSRGWFGEVGAVIWFAKYESALFILDIMMILTFGPGSSSSLASTFDFSPKIIFYYCYFLVLLLMTLTANL